MLTNEQLWNSMEQWQVGLFTLDQERLATKLPYPSLSHSQGYKGLEKEILNNSWSAGAKRGSRCFGRKVEDDVEETAAEAHVDSKGLTGGLFCGGFRGEWHTDGCWSFFSGPCPKKKATAKRTLNCKHDFKIFRINKLV